MAAMRNEDVQTSGGRLFTREPWMDQASCVGVSPDLFFPERGESTADAKAVCRACPVCGDCLEYALAGSEKFGIWGGLSERERRRLRRSRRLGSP